MSHLSYYADISIQDRSDLQKEWSWIAQIQSIDRWFYAQNSIVKSIFADIVFRPIIESQMQPTDSHSSCW